MNRAFWHLLQRATLASVVTLLPASAIADSSGSGSYTTEDAKAKFNHVYAYRVVDPDDPANVHTEVLLAEKPLDKAAIAQGLRNRDGGSTTSVMWEKVEGAFIKLGLQESDNVDLYAYIPPGYNFNYGGSGAQLSVNTPTRVEGAFKLEDTDMDGKPRKIELKFAADVDSADASTASGASSESKASQSNAVNESEESASDSGEAVVAKGDPLPADGGEPGKAFLAAMAATRAGDVDKMLALSSSDTRAKMEAERGTPDFKQMVELMQKMTPPKTPITGGSVDGDTATVLFEGQYDDGNRSNGTATLQREEGAWRLKQVEEKIGSTK